jgi:type II secretory pathway pseudopilin PulG
MDQGGGSVTGLFRVLLLVGFIAKLWPVIVFVCVFAVLCVVLWRFVRWLDRRLDARDARRAARAAKLAAIARRADIQHAQVLAGDDRGIYGDYAPKQTN